MAIIELPPRLISDVESGKVVLMLGAGASFRAVNKQGQNPPGAQKLAEMIAAQFLPPGYEKLPLIQVADYAINESSLFSVQESIANIFQGFLPTKSHLKMTTFRWRGIVTTNYDLLIETAFIEEKKAAQKVIPIIENSDNFDDPGRDRNDLLLLKLHGCITRTKNADCPLILGTDQYVSYEKGRHRLFSKFKEWAAERSVLFVGYGLQDQNLRYIMQEIDDEMKMQRPRYYHVVPNAGDVEKRYWDKHGITTVSGSFDDLIETLDAKVGSTFRGIVQSEVPGNLAIAARFKKQGMELSRNAKQFMENDVDYVKEINAFQKMVAQQFYKGVDCGWSGIEQDLDVQRPLMDTIIIDQIIPDDSETDRGISLAIIKGHAGAGKSVLLKRTAWNAAKSFDKLCLFLRPEGSINPSALAEIAEMTGEPVMLFIESAINRRFEIEALFATSKQFNGKIVILSTSRTNEWNQAPNSLKSLADTEYDLPYLTLREITQLLILLTKHKALGRLEGMQPEERVEALAQRAGRQLLVALHEATLGKSFVEIVKDEYENVTPPLAKEMYLTVCFLNQFNVSVRASIIARMYGVPYEVFREKFFQPLEELVITINDRIARDFSYVARHPHIAEMVVQIVLSGKEELFGAILKHVQYLNPGYRDDRIALTRLLSGNILLSNFPDHQMVTQIYDATFKVTGEDAFLLQQRAIYEMKRPSGNLTHATQWLTRALEMSPGSKSIKHTLSELLVRKAEASTLYLERRKFLDEATGICKELKRRTDEAFPFYTLVKIGVCRIRDTTSPEPISENTMEVYIQETEKELSEGLQRFPNNAQLRSAEALLATALSEDGRILTALQKAFELNPRNNFIAMRLARHYRDHGNLPDAMKILRKALDHKGGDLRLNYTFAEFLVETSSTNNDEILYHLERAYAPGDSNYDAQFLHARQLFVMEKCRESRPLFRSLKYAKVDPETKRSIRFPMPQEYTGAIDRLEFNHARIRRDGDGEWISVWGEETLPEVWRELSIGKRVKFKIGFSMKGPIALELALR